MKQFFQKYFLQFFTCYLWFVNYPSAQVFIPADPYHLLHFEKSQYQNNLSDQSNLIRPIFFRGDSISFSLGYKIEGYYNDNAPNQENMDVRYFSKGSGNFNSFSIAFNSPFFNFLVEPYILTNNILPVIPLSRRGEFAVLNDRPLAAFEKPRSSGFRNLLAFIHYKGIGIGWQAGNRWWGPGYHSSLSMTNNTVGIPATTIGTIKEIRWGSFGFFVQHTFAKMWKATNWRAKYFTALTGSITWYGSSSINITAGFSRNYLTGGVDIGVPWSEEDAKKIIFEGIFIKNLLEKEYTVGGGDPWDQTLSFYLSLNFPSDRMKIYTEIGFNDNRLHFADFISQPDHAMATIFGFRKYGLGEKNPNIIMGFEWTNLMISFSSRYRVTPMWYERTHYEHHTYYGRRWAAHSGSDSDDWFIYAGYLSDKFMFVPAFNYERHGIVTNRPPEVKLEFRLDMRYNYNDIWFGIYFEKQFESFLGFPQYYYVDELGNPSMDWEGDLANSRKTNSIIFSISKFINY